MLPLVKTTEFTDYSNKRTMIDLVKMARFLKTNDESIPQIMEYFSADITVHEISLSGKNAILIYCTVASIHSYNVICL
ncbi:hypothetical protein IEQ34_016871 [Dendrobium chrysotoxum]|uniref:Uncharacterized protein n=1 Tax=Dendrobium chrysotoxum TaxID=161865 RepID=A0AAV7GFG2_DENCH|nr:hypothetical protein IEQ34_016871 [Dendrobium chrysotoxum]